MVRVRAVAVAAAIANFFIRVTPVFFKICAGVRLQGYQYYCRRCANFLKK